MEGFDNAAFRAQLNSADLINPDGMPLVWALRALGAHAATRVYGPDATVILLSAAQEASIPVGFLGGTPETLDKLLEEIAVRYPRLRIAYAYSPPFPPPNQNADVEMVSGIAASGARLLFVGLGCPKQERWVIDHRGRVPAVLLAVGAAFDFLAGTKSQAPRWMMRCGLEWTFRLASEPRRLARRYLRHNPRFVFYFFAQWLRSRRPLGKLRPLNASPAPFSQRITSINRWLRR
jgi:N-acetylglucosaminyldiphosphoundecaprenol N-acetyl-beta-D-mannosaminyltransferase